MINGINKDGFAYVLYINGGHQQWMILYPFKQKLMLYIFTLGKHHAFIGMHKPLAGWAKPIMIKIL